MKATEQYLPVVLFIMLYKVVLTYESVDKILQCDYLNERSSVIPFCGTACFSVFYKIKFDILIEFLFYRLLRVIRSVERSSDKRNCMCLIPAMLVLLFFSYSSHKISWFNLC